MLQECMLFYKAREILSCHDWFCPFIGMKQWMKPGFQEGGELDLKRVFYICISISGIWRINAIWIGCILFHKIMQGRISSLWWSVTISKPLWRVFIAINMLSSPSPTAPEQLRQNQQSKPLPKEIKCTDIKVKHNGYHFWYCSCTEV